MMNMKTSHFLHIVKLFQVLNDQTVPAETTQFSIRRQIFIYTQLSVKKSSISNNATSVSTQYKCQTVRLNHG